MEFGSQFERSNPLQVVGQGHHGVNIYGAFGDYQRSGQLRQYAIAEREDSIANAKKKLENQVDVIPKLKQNCEKMTLEIKVEEALTSTEIGLKLKQERQANQIEANYEEYLDELERVKANHYRFVQYENSRKSKLQNVERDYIERCKKIPEVCSLIDATNELNNLDNRLQTEWKNLTGLRQEVQQMKTESHTNWKTFQQVCIEVARNEKAKSLHKLNTEKLEAKKKQLKTRKDKQDAEKRLMERKIHEAGGYHYSPMRYDPYVRYGYPGVNRSPYMMGGMKHSSNATQWKQYVNKISLQQQHRGGSSGRSDPLTTKRFPETVPPTAQLQSLMSPGPDSQRSRFGPSSRLVYPAPVTPNPTARQFSQVSLPPTTPGSLPPETPVSLPPATPVSLPPATPVSLPPATPVSHPPETPESFSSTPFSLPPTTPGSFSSTPVSLPPATPISLPPATPVSLPPETPVSLPPATPISLPPATSISLPPATPISLPPVTPDSLPPATPVSLPPATPDLFPSTTPVFKTPLVQPTQSEPCNMLTSAPDSPFSIASQPIGLSGSAPSPMNFSMFGDPQQTVPSTEAQEFGGGFMNFFGGAGGGGTGNADNSSFFFDMGNSTQGSDVSSFF